MSTTEEKIREIEAEMARTQKNKATSGHLGLLKAKIAKLKRELIAPKSKGPAGEGFDVNKAGDARVGLLGFPSVGKSTLLSAITGTTSLAASYEFTTLTCIPGTFQYKGCRIQLLDLPGIIEGAKDGKGRGRQVIGVARTCDTILLVLDAGKPMTHKRIIERELEGYGIRLNKSPPNIFFKKKDKGGIQVTLAPGIRLSHLTTPLITAICKESKISNAEFVMRCDATVDDIIDIVEGNRVYIPCIYVMNKIDSVTLEELELLAQVPHYCPIASRHGWGFDDLLEMIWKYLNMIRVYTKPKGLIPDYSSPIVVPRNRRTVEQFCLRIHKSLVRDFKFARVWGTSVKHNPQRVGLEHILNDEDVVQVVKKHN
jgi:small GTP-binding protein